MRKASILTVLIVAVAFMPASATIINIPGDYPTIQQGINASSDGDTVLVQQGTYVENINFNGHNIVLGSLFLTTGDTSYISQTIIDGDSSGTVVTIEHREGSLITGFTIRNGVARYGGGIYCNDSYPIIFDNIIRGNSAYLGGGIFALASNLMISHNIIYGNNASGGGGIACREDSSPIISHNTIYENSAARGGGIYCVYFSNPTIVNNTITENSASAYGGAVYGSSDSNPSMTNSICWYNSGQELSGYIDITYSDIRGGWEGEGNISMDPLFVDPDYGDYNLCAQSPCIDAGDPDMQDPDGTRSDIGVFYWEHPECYLRSIWYVSTVGDDTTGDGSPENPFRTIQFAIDVARHVDTVIVENGVYSENINIQFKSISLASNYIFSGDTLDIQNTIIDGDSVSIVISFESCDSLAHLIGFTMRNGLDAGVMCHEANPAIGNNIILSNFGEGIDCRYGSNPIIENNMISDNADDGIICSNSNPLINENVISANIGHGIYCNGSSPTITNINISANSGNGIYCYTYNANFSSNPIISSCTIANNASSGVYCDVYNFNVSSNPIISNSIINSNSNSGVYCIHSNPDITANTFIGNSTIDKGGAIYCFYSDPIITDNIFTENLADSSGGGIYCNYSNPTISDNVINENLSNKGGAVYCDSSSPTISNNTIVGNVGLGGGIYCRNSNPSITGNEISNNLGGGIYCSNNSNPLITNNVINSNSAEDGGGILCSNSNPSINNNIIMGNSAIWEGGGIYCENSDPIVGYNTIDGNSAEDGGGGIYCQNSNPLIRNNTITRNSDIYKGAGILCLRSGPSIVNNTISGNVVYSIYNGAGGGIYCRDSSPIITNTIFWADTAGIGNEIFIYSGTFFINYSNIQGGWEGEGNIDTDPLFRDPENNDYHLMVTYCDDPFDSPCIDAGQPTIADSILDCSWGLETILSDMGAYGGGAVMVDIEILEVELPDCFALFQNYPNPFNATTTIRYKLSQQSYVTIEIYDILGRKVEMLVDKQQPAGYHHVVWDANDKSSGMYFYRIKTGDYTETKKMLLLK